MTKEHSKNLDVSDDLLNAFVDNELDAADKANLLDLMVTDPSAQLRGRVCELWQIKELMRNAYPRQESATTVTKRNIAPGRRFTQALAAGLMLTVGTLIGWFGRDGQDTTSGLQLTVGQITGSKVVLHIASADPQRLKLALEEAEELSQERDRAGNPVQVELMANESGLNLFREGISPYAGQIAAMASARHNVSFLACNNTMTKLRNAGTTVNLLPHITVAPSVAELIKTRVQNGWTYIQV